eukprot:514764-Prymnesium_polylepis.1
MTQNRVPANSSCRRKAPARETGFRPVGATLCKTGFRNLFRSRVTGRATRAETRFLASVKTPQS